MATVNHVSCAHAFGAAGRGVDRFDCGLGEVTVGIVLITCSRTFTVSSIQPLYDATDKSKATGGWGNLLDYLRSEAFQQTFQTSKYVIIQIDTDKSEEYGVPKNDASGELRGAGISSAGIDADLGGIEDVADDTADPDVGADAEAPETATGAPGTDAPTTDQTV